MMGARFLAAVALGVVAGILVAALDLAGRTDLSRVGICALVMLTVAIVLLAVALGRKRVPDRSPAGVAYYLMAAGGFVGPLVVLLHAVPHLPTASLSPVMGLAPLTAAALRKDARSVVAGAGIIFAAGLLLASSNPDDLPWTLVAAASAIVAGSVYRLLHAMRPATDDVLQGLTGIALAATVMLMLAYMNQGSVIDLSAEWDAGAWLVPFLAALALAGIALHHLVSGAQQRVLAVAVAITCGFGWQVGVQGLRPGPTVWVAAVVLALVCAAVGLARSPTARR